MKGILALIIGVGIVEIAIDEHLPGDFHLVAVDGGEHRPVIFRIVEDGAFVRNRDDVFAIGEDIAGARIFLRTQPVNVGCVGISMILSVLKISSRMRATRQFALSFTNR